MFTECLSCRVKPGIQKLEKTSQIESFLNSKFYNTSGKTVANPEGKKMPSFFLNGKTKMYGDSYLKRVNNTQRFNV
jgi:hypothetical protein